jgi:hypothetical protein
MELENSLSKVNQLQKDTQYALTDKWILAQKFRIPKVQFTDYMKPKKKEDQSVDTSVLLRRGNKILTGGNMDIKCGRETEGKAIQRLPHKPRHYCRCQEVPSDRSLIWLSPEWFFQSLTNTEVDAHSQPLD